MELPKIKIELSLFLAITTTVGLFGLIALICFRDIPESSAQIVNVLLGSVSTAWTGIVGYYFGSSSGSSAKTTLLANRDKEQNGPHV